MNRILFFTITVFCLQYGTISNAAEIVPKDPPKLAVLKLDDVVAGGRGQVVPPRWQRVADYLEGKKIKSSMGVIGFSLVDDNPAYFKWITDRAERGYIEFWNHGFRQRLASDEFGEFEGSYGYEEQLQALRLTDRLATEKLGLKMSVWGPHWSGTNEHTDRALAQVPQIRMTFGYPPKVEHYKGFVFRKKIDIEYPTHNPDFEAFLKAYQSKKNSLDSFYLQGHPDSWDETRWENFVKIIEFLQTENVRFVTPSELYDEVHKPKL